MLLLCSFWEWLNTRRTWTIHWHPLTHIHIHKHHTRFTYCTGANDTQKDVIFINSVVRKCTSLSHTQTHSFINQQLIWSVVFRFRMHCRCLFVVASFVICTKCFYDTRLPRNSWSRTSSFDRVIRERSDAFTIGIHAPERPTTRNRLIGGHWSVDFLVCQK